MHKKHGIRCNNKTIIRVYSKINGWKSDLDQFINDSILHNSKQNITTDIAWHTLVISDSYGRGKRNSDRPIIADFFNTYNVY